MSAIETGSDAIRLLSAATGYEESFFSRRICDGEDRFHVMPQNEELEGLPCYWVFKESGKIQELYIRHAPEVLAWYELPTTREYDV
ncbi:hypothetical protein [Corynebacterium renale]|uniref:hypothetical protein n=1 Tax=Corynebacterium renale TaxID=1724 RepID=UPI0011AB778F|nr:hypothetical protein [Corynebacterium renale]